MAARLDFGEWARGAYEVSEVKWGAKKFQRRGAEVTQGSQRKGGQQGWGGEGMKTNVSTEPDAWKVARKTVKAVGEPPQCLGSRLKRGLMRLGQSNWS